MERKVEKKAYRRTMQMILQNEKMKLKAGEGVEDMDINAILPVS